MVVGRLEQPKPVRKALAKIMELTGVTSNPEAREATDAYTTARVLDGLSVIETTCEVRPVGKPCSFPAWKLPSWIRSRKSRGSG